jgi:tRNA threonylcarbamoyl adenosine modification protein (Sua5/YciO/YrdC/YwlC family)
MVETLHIHPDNPQARLLSKVADIVRKGGLVAYPTDSAYALGCHLGDKEAVDRIRRIRELDKHHNFTLVCRDLSELGNYAKVDNQVFRLLKAHTPGPYTFILNATSEVPRRLMHPKRKTIGLRVPDNAITQGLLAELGEPLISVTFILPGDEYPLSDPDDIRDRLGARIDALVDGGCGSLEPTTVIDLSGAEPRLLRRGMGDPEPFGCA